MGTIILKIFNMGIVALLLFVSMAYAYPRPQQDQRPAGAAPAPSYGKQPDGYFQYVNVPGHKEYEFGWNRGHPNHIFQDTNKAKITDSVPEFVGEIPMMDTVNIIGNITTDHLMKNPRLM